MKTIVTRLTFVALFSIGLISCNNNSKSVFACPMKCQQDTAYVGQGSCPVCGMDLEATADYDSTKTNILNNTK